ncbi:hypothetical protein D3C86_1810750 [compost metagenome]
MREQIIIANEGGQGIELAGAQITNRHRLQFHFGIDRRRQQSTVKGAQRAAIGGGAFREHQQRMFLLQMAGHLFTNQLAVARTATDEQAAGLGRQPARHGPGTHFGLGQE